MPHTFKRRDLLKATAAVAAGYTENNPDAMIAETYFGMNQAAEGLDFLKGAIERQVAAGQTVPEAWFVRGLKVAYDARLNDKAIEWSALLVAHAPNPTNWQRSLQVVDSLSQLDAQARLDPDGQVLWARDLMLGPTNPFSSPLDITATADGGVVLTGSVTYSELQGGQTVLAVNTLREDFDRDGRFRSFASDLTLKLSYTFRY